MKRSNRSKFTSIIFTSLALISTDFAAAALAAPTGQDVKSEESPSVPPVVNQAKAETEAEEKKVSELAVQVLIDAPPETVWIAIHEERDSAPGLASSKILTQEANHYRLEQKYTVIPFMSSITRTLDVDEVPNERIDYKVVPLGHDRPLKGSWILKPEEDGKKTSLTLTAESVRIGNNMLKRAAAKLWIERRLAHVKQFAEKTNHLKLEGRVLPKAK